MDAAGAAPRRAANASSAHPAAVRHRTGTPAAPRAFRDKRTAPDGWVARLIPASLPTNGCPGGAVPVATAAAATAAAMRRNLQYATIPSVHSALRGSS